MTIYSSFTGTVTSVTNYNSQSKAYEGCSKFITLESKENIVNFVMTPSTFIVDYDSIAVGDFVEGFFDGFAPTIMIYPPQYPALVMAKIKEGQNVKVDNFDENLISSDGELRLNISLDTKTTLKNGQEFIDSIQNRDLVVIYGATTKSIPAQTTPSSITVLCSK